MAFSPRLISRGSALPTITISGNDQRPIDRGIPDHHIENLKLVPARHPPASPGRREPRQTGIIGAPLGLPTFASRLLVSPGPRSYAGIKARSWRVLGVLGQPSPLGVRSARAQAPHDVFDIGAAAANGAQLKIGELKPFVHIPEPSADLFRDHFEGDHLESFSDAPGRVHGRNPFVAGSQSGRTACSAKVSAKACSRRASLPVLQNS
jgi:hypothetical protein